MSVRERPDRTYRFGPLERRGLVGSFRLGQVLTLAAGCCAAVVLFRSSPTPAGFVGALLLLAAALATAFVPVAGRTLEDWAPVLSGWARARVRGAHRYRSLQPSSGMRASVAAVSAELDASLPDALAGCELLSVELADGHELGVFKDERLGALTAVLAVRARSLGLLPTAEHERRLARWGQLLASLAKSGTPLRRLQLLERTAPSDGDALRRYLTDARDPAVPEDDPVHRSYAALVEGATRVTQDHELLLAVQIDVRKAWARASRDARVRGLDRDEQASQVLIRELQTLAGRFAPLDLTVSGLLTPRQLAASLHTAFDPYARGRAGDVDGIDPQSFGPTAADANWASYRVDGAVHRTYWIAQWPRLAVGPLFLTPLLLGVQAVRTVSVTLEPVAPERSRRAVEAAITSDEADEQVRSDRGFRTTARRRRQQEATHRREEELASGHEELRFAGHVTVTGRDEDELRVACEEIEQAAQQAHLELRPLWGEQDSAFVQAALPIARGLRTADFLSGT